MKIYRAYVKGEPIPEGSMKAFPYQRKSGGVGVSMVHQNSNLTKWRNDIHDAFFRKYGTCPDGGFIPQYAPVSVAMCFFLPKPKNVKCKRPTSKKADIDKLCRAVNDSLTGYVYYDDCQIISMIADKSYADEDNPMGVDITVYELTL